MENIIGFNTYNKISLSPKRVKRKKKRKTYMTLEEKKRYLASRVLTQQEVNALSFLFIVCLMVIWFNVSTISANAASFVGLQDIYNSEAFIGNTKWLEKINFLGKFVQALISIGGTVAATIIACQIFLTIIYFGMPNLWDSVNQAKIVDQKKGLMNYTASLFAGGKSGMVGNLSRGSDIFMDFIVLMLPNVKKYSENADDEYENFATWFMGTSIRKCITLTAISMMINGSLMQGYMVVVDGFGELAKRFVEVDGSAFVNRMLTTGDNYQFALGKSGQGFDVLQGNVANSVYREIMKSSDFQDTDSKFTAGSLIEKYVKQNITKDSVLSKMVGAGSEEGSLSESDWSRVKVQVVLNGTGGTTNSMSVSASDLGLSTPSGAKPRYIHMYFTLRSKGDTTYYFGLPNSDD